MKKSFFSFGGSGVKKIKKKSKLKNNEYFQKIEEGEHISVQFFSQEKKIKILSVCDQYFLKEDKKPFVIKGIISKSIKSGLLKKLKMVVLKLSKIYNLNGINNLDLVLKKGSEKFFVIELNGRPGLSTNLIYKINKNIFKKYELIKQPTKQNFFYSSQIIYSKKKIIVTKNNLKFIRSLKHCHSFSELPQNKQIINIGEPICLIHLKSKKIEILREKLEKISYKIHINLN